MHSLLSAEPQGIAAAVRVFVSAHKLISKESVIKSRSD